MIKITEAGFLDSIKGKLGFKAPPNQLQPTPAKQDNPDIARSTEQSEQEDPLSHVVSSIVRPVTQGQVRIVVNLDRSELTSFYLKTDPESHQKLANMLLGINENVKYNLISILEDEPNIAAATQDAEKQAAAKLATMKQDKANKTISARVSVMKSGYKFSDLFKSSKTQDAVLLDIPIKLYDNFKNATSQASKTKTLAQMFDHKYYVMTINTPRAREIAQHFDSAGGDLDKEKAAFNPSIIVNYPRKQTIKLAKEAWNSKFAQKHSSLVSPPASSNHNDNIKDAEEKLAQSVRNSTEAPHSIPAENNQSPEHAHTATVTPESTDAATKNIRSAWSKYTNGGTVSNKDMSTELKELISHMYRQAHPGSWQEYMTLKKTPVKKKRA